MAGRGLSTRELVKYLRNYARNKKIYIDIKKHESKGSHRRIYLGNCKTTVPWSGNLKKGVISAILKQLHVAPDDFWPK